MAVISLSIEEKLLNHLDSIEEELDYSGRSEIVRSAIRSFISDKKGVEDLEGTVNCILTITHENNDLDEVSEIQHKHQSIVKTQIHDHLQDHTCLQTYVLEGDAEKVKDLWSNFQSSKKVKKVDMNIL